MQEYSQQYTPLYVESSISSRNLTGQRHYTNVFALTSLSRLQEISEEGQVFNSSAEVRKVRVLRTRIEGVINARIYFTRFKAEIEGAGISGKVHLFFRTGLYNFKVMATNTILTAKIVCDKTKGEEEFINFLDYREGIKLIEGISQVPKFYIDRVIFGLLNLTERAPKTLITMRNIGAEIEIKENEVIFRFLNQT